MFMEILLLKRGEYWGEWLRKRNGTRHMQSQNSTHGHQKCIYKLLYIGLSNFFWMCLPSQGKQKQK